MKQAVVLEKCQQHWDIVFDAFAKNISQIWHIPVIFRNMSSKKEKLVRVSFFELLAGPGGVSSRVPAINWAQRLLELASKEALEVHYNGRTLDGKVFDAQDIKGLSLSIDRAIFPRERQRQTGERKTMKTSGVDYDPAEETIVVFFERNIFGMLSTGQGAPSHTAVAAWLNIYMPCLFNPAYKWRASSITRKDIYESVVKSKKMQVVESTFKVEPKDLSPQDYGVFGLFADKFFDIDDGFSIKITFQAGRQRLLKNTKAIERMVDEGLKHGCSKKVSIKAKGDTGRQQIFDLLEDHVTYQVALDHQLFQGTGTEFLQVASSEIKHAYSELAAVLLKQVPETE
ncbi:hypothetical protein [Corynebacterium matruchotii]|uniref:hypothetical protein n=1 Tax=Corynebacterium matruchotii TaxID=43768 RepID=UPI00288AB025|nr:hypothetical protein [Corynebacterium matruchotii]